MNPTRIAAAMFAALACGFGGMAAAGPAAVAAPTVVAPPPLVVEAVPAPRAGAVWIPGTHVWQNGAFHWLAGHWIADEPGREWTEARWVQSADGRWQIAGGSWSPNRYLDLEQDRRDDTQRFGRGDLDRDGIRNAQDSDFDGDGLANWEDEFPLNAARS